MAITILQQPQALTFVGNIPDLIAQSEGLNMTVNISTGGTLILSESYTADTAGRVRVPLKDFLNERLTFNLPTGNLFQQTGTVKQFDIELISGTDTTDISFVAIKGGVDKALLDCTAYLKEAWLTWQPQTKYVKDVEPEWLGYFAVEAATVKVKAYFSGGTSETITLHELEAAKHYTINVTFSDIRELFTLQPIYFDVWVENEGIETYHQRYVLTTEDFDYDDLFVFENSVGGLDTIRLTGEKRAVNPVEVNAALLYDEHAFDYQVNPNKAYEKNTGYFRSKDALLWAQDFFQSLKKYIYLEEELIPIVLRNPEILTLERELVDFDFVFAYTRQTPYLALFKKKSPLIDPVIIGPGDEEFYLPPQISDFPQLDDPGSALFPVQIPGTPGWFFLTWATILAYIYDGLPLPAHNATTGIQGGTETERFHLTAPELAKVQSLPEEFIEDHNDLNNIQGGLPGEYWHFSEEEHEKVLELLSPPSIDRISQVGTINFISATELEAEDWKAIFSGIELDTTPLTISGITGTPVDFDRGDALYYKPDGTLGYSTGVEDSEGTPLPPAIPTGTLRMADILRKPTGENIIDLIAAQTSDFVSKSDEDLQTIASNLAITPQAGPLPNIVIFDVNGVPRRSNPAYAGYYSTLQGIGGFSKILTITIDPVLQVNYYAVIEFSGISTNYEKGFLWVQFKIDGSGDIITNALKCFGEFDLSKYTLIKTSGTTYTLYVAHDEVNAFYRFRPHSQFGASFRYVYHHLEAKVEPLPAGDQYDFTLHGDLSEILADIAELFTDLIALETAVADHEDRIEDLEAAPSGGLPPGGTTGQVLAKQSGTDGDADWETPSGGADTNAVHYNAPDGKTASEKQQARDNIGLTEGIPTINTTDANINNCARPSNLIVFNTGFLNRYR